MGQSSYHCVCYTCRQERVEESVADAETFFDYHAGQDHAVEVVRLGPEQYLENS